MPTVRAPSKSGSSSKKVISNQISVLFCALRGNGKLDFSEFLLLGLQEMGRGHIKLIKRCEEGLQF